MVDKESADSVFLLVGVLLDLCREHVRVVSGQKQKFLFPYQRSTNAVVDCAVECADDVSNPAA
ncbi:MAG: hypothetical protein ACOYJR_05145 [Acutalibacteraceae bacterium]